MTCPGVTFSPKPSDLPTPANDNGAPPFDQAAVAAAVAQALAEPAPAIGPGLLSGATVSGAGSDL